MNFSLGSLSRRKTLLAGLVLVIIIMGAVTWYNWPECSTIRFIDASVTVKTVPSKVLLGFNTDTDSLKFGTVSPGSEVKRTVITHYAQAAQVRITAEGELASWITITPAEFSLASPESLPVTVQLNIPDKYVYEGNYTGKVKFCFKE